MDTQRPYPDLAVPEALLTAVTQSCPVAAQPFLVGATLGTFHEFPEFCLVHQVSVRHEQHVIRLLNEINVS